MSELSLKNLFQNLCKLRVVFWSLSFFDDLSTLLLDLVIKIFAFLTGCLITLCNECLTFLPQLCDGFILDFPRLETRIHAKYSVLLIAIGSHHGRINIEGHTVHIEISEVILQALANIFRLLRFLKNDASTRSALEIIRKQILSRFIPQIGCDEPNRNQQHRGNRRHFPEPCELKSRGAQQL